MKTSRHQNVARRKRRIERRLRPRTWTAQARPMYRATNLQYEHSDRTRGLATGGIGAMRRLAQTTGLVDAIDRDLQVLKVHLPYHESDHVLGIAYNVLLGTIEKNRASSTPPTPSQYSAGHRNLRARVASCSRICAV